MPIRPPAGVLAAVALLCSATAADAHVVAGSRVFPVTLTIDDPGTADEVSIPSFTYVRTGVQNDIGPEHANGLGFEYDKTITSNTALILNDGYSLQQFNGAKTQAGFENLFITGKWQANTNAAHEFVVSLGVIREIGGTGTTHTGGNRYGSTAPTSYFGKGLGDLPIGYARPLAVTGELSSVVADHKLKQFQAVTPLPAPINRRTLVAARLRHHLCALQAGHSHAASMYARPNLLLLADILHLLATGLWLGALLPLWLTVAVAPARAGSQCRTSACCSCPPIPPASSTPLPSSPAGRSSRAPRFIRPTAPPARSGRPRRWPRCEGLG